MKTRMVIPLVFLAAFVATSLALAQEKPRTFAWTMMVTVKLGAEDVFRTTSRSSLRRAKRPALRKAGESDR